MSASVIPRMGQVIFSIGGLEFFIGLAGIPLICGIFIAIERWFVTAVLGRSLKITPLRGIILQS
ncbi:MAG: hypothetical protein KDD42_06865, partial [Bdellovibrionales bacterium]|nr:hypothetical protein [Bdellovibrionales bacterium]